MSTLEATVKPVVDAMINDISLTLNANDQMSIAVWAAKTAMVLEATIRESGHRLYTRVECEQLRLNSTIPSRSLIWLGRIVDSGVFASGTHVWLKDNLGESCDGQVSTFTVGHLAIQILTIHVRQDDSVPMRTVCRDDPWDDSLLGIYPINRSVLWPPRLAFSVQGALPFVTLRDRWKIGHRR
jgi:hypothetical protein